MSQAGGPSVGKRVVPAQMNIYTVLAVVATLALIVGVGYVWKTASDHNPEQSPWYVEPDTADQAAMRPAAS